MLACISSTEIYRADTRDPKASVGRKAPLPACLHLRQLGAENAEPAHSIEQRCPFHRELRGSAVGTSNDPIGLSQGFQDVFAFGLRKRFRPALGLVCARELT